jgi:hypothetical protein
MNFNIQTAAMFVFFVFDENGLIKGCSSFEDLSVYKISCSHVEWFKFCIHLRSLNVRHFGMVKYTGLKSTTSRSPSMAFGITLLDSVRANSFVATLQNLPLDHRLYLLRTKVRKNKTSFTIWLSDLTTEFHKNLPIGSKVIGGGGGHTDRLTDRQDRLVIS